MEGYFAPFWTEENGGGMSVKIAFWGMEKSFHTTEIMIVMADLLAKCRPGYDILVQQKNGWQCIFSGGKERILFADCGYGGEKKIQNSLKKADIIVTGICSYPIEWEDMIRRFVREKKQVFYLIEGYALYADQMKSEMVHRYRIAPEQIGYIPQNGELEWVSEQGKIDNFIRSWRRKSETERNESFFGEMQSNLFLLMKQIEKKENGGFNYGTGNETLWKCDSCSNCIIGTGRNSCGSTVIGRVCCDGI